MNNDFGGMLIGQQLARKAIESQFDSAIVRRKPSMFKKLMKRLAK
ncbi:hypothetical protein [Vibrio superstes]|uniref:Uncharacterized protein n=1 Tax=Vibrio superstes NBRC 103154 TaxID=1219062 RepID=A0A511QPE1_9VIBR|nr:hypothetical protein [Vibrio superstes]GEM79199.1 hypothetical protein VSU01S_14440 [Vibrio superstes NBRC 103154]